MSPTTAHPDTWDRVTRHDPCPICQKPDFCKITPGGEVCGCMRPGENTTRLHPFKVVPTGLGEMALFRLTADLPRDPRPRPQAAHPQPRPFDTAGARAVYRLVADHCAAALPAEAVAELARRFGPVHGPRAAREFGIGYCDSSALAQALAAAGRRSDAVAAGVLRPATGQAVHSLGDRLVLPYRRGGATWDLRGSGIKGRDETKELSLPGSYTSREVDGLFFNHDALDALPSGGTIHLAGGAWKTIALALAGLPAIGTRGEGELSDAQLAALAEAGVGELILHIDAEDPKAGEALSAGRRLALPKAERLATIAPVFVAEPPREPGTPKVDPDALLRDFGPGLLRAYALSAVPLDRWRVLIGVAAPAAADPDLVARLRADVARLGDEVRAARAEKEHLAVRLRHSDEEGERMVLHITQLEAANAALEAAIAHPNQAAGVGALDLVDAAERAYAAGKTLTVDGRDYARVPFAQAAQRRSAKTVARGFTTLCEAGTLDAFTREEQIETPKFKGKVAIAYLFLPPAVRGQRGKAVLGILPTCAGAKDHGGRRTIPVPPEVAAQAHPVRRERELVTRWYSALSDAKIATETPTRLGTDYWTAGGAQLLPEEVERQRVAAGYQPPRPPAYRPPAPPTQTPLRAVPRQDADRGPLYSSRQDAEVPAPPVDERPGICTDPDCERPVRIGGFCEHHYDAYRRRHAPAWDDAAGGG